jgi:hypothetical protein
VAVGTDHDLQCRGSAEMHPDRFHNSAGIMFARHDHVIHTRQEGGVDDPWKFRIAMQTVFQHYFLTEVSMLAICCCRSIVSMAVAIFSNDFSARPLASQ